MSTEPLNCKQGDIVLIVQSPNRAMLGVVVTCLAYEDRLPALGPLWETERVFARDAGDGKILVGRFVPDSYLLPVGAVSAAELEQLRKRERSAKPLGAFSTRSEDSEDKTTVEQLQAEINPH